MITQSISQPIAAQLQMFKEIEQKEQFLFVLGALVAKLISLHKAAEMMKLEPDFLLTLLDLIGIEFSYLSEEDVELEKRW
jgi:predicted HTH domain antitoxin